MSLSDINSLQSVIVRKSLKVVDLYKWMFVFAQNQGKTSAAAGTSFEAQESSLAEECDAICRLHGVPAGAPLAVQLKALDAEYHQLLDRGQSAKADHIQALFTWKSKMASQVFL